MRWFPVDADFTESMRFGLAGARAAGAWLYLADYCQSRRLAGRVPGVLPRMRAFLRDARLSLGDFRAAERGGLVQWEGDDVVLTWWGGSGQSPRPVDALPYPTGDERSGQLTQAQRDQRRRAGLASGESRRMPVVIEDADAGAGAGDHTQAKDDAAAGVNGAGNGATNGHGNGEPMETNGAVNGATNGAATESNGEPTEPNGLRWLDSTRTRTTTTAPSPKEVISNQDPPYARAATTAANETTNGGTNGEPTEATERMGNGEQTEPGEAGHPQSQHALVPVAIPPGHPPPLPVEHLRRRVEGVSPSVVRSALTREDLIALVRAFGITAKGDRLAEWQRDADGEQLVLVALVLAWRRQQRDPIREPSGFRQARERWKAMPQVERDDCIADLAPPYGIPIPPQVLRRLTVAAEVASRKNLGDLAVPEPPEAPP